MINSVTLESGRKAGVSDVVAQAGDERGEPAYVVRHLGTRGDRTTRLGGEIEGSQGLLSCLLVECRWLEV